MATLLKELKGISKKASDDIKKELQVIAKETGKVAQDVSNIVEQESLKLQKEAKKALPGKIIQEGSTSKFVFTDAPDLTHTQLSQFNPTPKNRYHAPNNLILCEAARLSYKRADRCQTALKKWGFSESQTFASSEGDFGYIAKTPTFIVVAFRGTNDPVDWITNLTVERVAFMGRKQWKVHKGIRNAFYRLWRTHEMFNALIKMRDNKQPLFICGHSLGGGLAVMAAAWIAMSADKSLTISDIGALLTIGQPRVMNAGLSTALNRKNAFLQRYFRYSNAQDPVPSVPLEAFLGKNLYRHGGTPLDFDSKGKLKISTQPERALTTNHDVSQHSSALYSDRMLANLKSTISRNLPYGR